MIIKNYQKLATTSRREKALQIISAGIERVLPQNIIGAAIQYDAEKKTIKVNGIEHNFSKGRLFVIGGGKAAGLMAQSLESAIPVEDIEAGVVTCHNSGAKTKKIKVIKASHPLPSQEGMRGVQEMLELKEKHDIREDDLVLCLISGGGSALMPYPVDGVTLEEKQAVTKSLLRSGASINEVNIVRKHLSQVKGGQLGQNFAPARVVSLILSDVIGNDLSTIASGPTTPDPSEFADAVRVLKEYELWSNVPDRVSSYLQKGQKETPTELPNCTSHIIGDNKLALEAMKKKASELGLQPEIVTAEEKGETDEIVKKHIANIKADKYTQANILIMGGEPTPTLPDNPGKGGRNQYYAAAALLALRQEREDWLVASVATDGSDFMPDIAGGLVDRESLKEVDISAEEMQKYLDRFDSYNLLQKIDNSLIITGKTGTNVGDIMIWIL